MFTKNIKKIIRHINKKRNGSYTHLAWKTVVKDYINKEYKGRVEKVVEGTYRIGVHYEAMKCNQDKVMGPVKISGNRYIGNDHKIILTSKNTMCLRLFNTYNSHHRCRVTYFLDGQEVSKQFLLDNGILKEKPSSEPLAMFNVQVQNLIFVH